MHAISKAGFPPALAIALLLSLTMAGPLSAASLTLEMDTLAATPSGRDLVLAFPTAAPELYTVQTTADLDGQWTNLQGGIVGNGTVNMVTVTNGISADRGFFRLLIQKPLGLLLPQSTAFAILGHSCGGIRERAYVTGFKPGSGYPTGEVFLTTTCSTGGRGSRPATFTAWVAATWDFAGQVISASTVSNGLTANPTFVATDDQGDVIYDTPTAAYLVVPVAAAPIGVTAVQLGDQFQVSWTPNGVNPNAVTASTLTATPVDSTASVLTSTVTGAATTGAISSLEPQTTYQITVVTTTIGGASPPSAPIEVTTVPASVAPSVPAGVTAKWTNLNPTGATDTLMATWQAAVAGDSPIDQYQVTITGSDGAGTHAQSVPGTTLTASFTVDYTPDWSVTVQAHNAFGWGPSSSVFVLGGL